MSIENELQIEAQKLGFTSPDEALNEMWDKIPSWLQQDLLKSGFKVKNLE